MDKQPPTIPPGKNPESTPFNTGGYEPPFFRERGAFPLCSGNANPLRFPPQRKGGSPKISAFPEKRGNGPKVGLVPGMTKPPTPQKCPFPLRVPTFVPGSLRPRFCSPFWFPLPFLVSLGAVCSGFRSPNEKTQKWRAPRGGVPEKREEGAWAGLAGSSAGEPARVRGQGACKAAGTPSLEDASHDLAGC